MSEFKLQLLLSQITTTLDSKSYDSIKVYINQIRNSLPKLLNGDWTYCSDELPDNDDEYLVMWKTQNSKCRFYEIQEFCDGDWNIHIPQATGDVKILAWQELPDLPMED